MPEGNHNSVSEKTAFYHGSRKLFRRGMVLTPQPSGYASLADNSAFEALVESRRPQGKTSRACSVFLVADPGFIDAAGGYIDAVYRVTPKSEPEMSDLAWYSEAYCAHDSDPSDLDLIHALIDNYWSGLPFKDPERSCPEYRCTSALVTKMAELNVERTDLEKIPGESEDPEP